MNPDFNPDVTDITIIVNKTEKEDFHFFNKSRQYDGFLLVTEGEGTAIDPQGTTHHIKKGDLVIVNKGESYGIDSVDGCSYIGSRLTLVANKAMLPFIYRCNKSQQRLISDVFYNWQSRSWDSFSYCRIKIMQLYLEIFQTCMKFSRSNGYVDSAIDFIHKNFKRNFTGNEIACECAISLSYLRSKFVAQTSMTIVEYRDSLRIATAREMIKSEYFTMSEISDELGYCDVYHFSKAFSAQTGESPSEYKRKIVQDKVKIIY